MLTNLPETRPAGKRAMIEQLVSALAQTPGVLAVVLGGSYARGAARPDSDVDLGLYYMPDSPFRIDDIAQVASELLTADVTVAAVGPSIDDNALLRLIA